MKIDSISLKNFRPFYGSLSVDLTVPDDRNIILIGGRNGHGKTNFLLSVVWCLYGKLISRVDDSFKMEINHNYTKFLDGVLNKDAKLENVKQFSVEIIFSDVSYGDDSQQSTIKIKRSYDIDTQKELLNVESSGDNLLLATSTDEEKQSFINDYLVPINIARFVFFDAEKISQIADLSTAKQAELMNQTLGNMLGLNIYQSLLNEIEAYIKQLKKESSTHETQEEITTFENTIKATDQRIRAKKEELQKKNQEIVRITDEIGALDIQINRKGGDTTDIEELHRQKEDLDRQRKEVEVKFNKISDVIPLFMLSGLIQEAKEQLEIEQENKKNSDSKEMISGKLDVFIEKLFNNGDCPDPDITLTQKAFYQKKSKELESYLSTDNQQNELVFTHDLDPSKFKDLEEVYQDIQTKSNAGFIDVITDFGKKKNQLHALDQKIKKLEASAADELTKSFADERNSCQNKKDDLIKKVGAIEGDISRYDSDKATHERRLLILYGKLTINETNQDKIKLAEKYINVLTDFIKNEKEDKKEIIEKQLLEELGCLWDKNLVTSINVEILPSDKGMEVELLDKHNVSINSKELSKGEQQLYVSALLKTILDSSVHDLPVFIDTPLGRLDNTHRDNILKHYYPKLSSQVVVFSTDTEVTLSKCQEIESYIERKYLLVNKDGKSNISNGYFK